MSDTVGVRSLQLVEVWPYREEEEEEVVTKFCVKFPANISVKCRICSQVVLGGLTLIQKLNSVTKHRHCVATVCEPIVFFVPTNTEGASTCNQWC